MDSRLPAAGTNGISDWPVYSISECISAVWVTPRQRPASEWRHSLILTAQTAPLSVPGQPTSSPICAGGDPNRSPEPFHIGTKASQIAGAGALSDRSGRCAGRHVHRPERASPKGSPASGPSETCSSVLTRAAIGGGDAWSAPPHMRVCGRGRVEQSVLPLGHQDMRLWDVATWRTWEVRSGESLAVSGIPCIIVPTGRFCIEPFSVGRIG